MSKRYGLIIPGKQKEISLPVASTSRPSIFKDETSESSSEEDLPKIRGKIQGPSIGPGAMERRQARSIQEKALAEDPTIFQYDEVYDEIESKRDEEKKSKTSEEKKPKYIARLLQQADRRKLENERRIERQVQKEREAEGEQFKDKESFVTSAYKIKLEELKKAEEAEKREEYLEAIGDVTKQGNLDGFYRHLYEQKLGPKETNENKTIKKETTENKESSNKDLLKIKQNNKTRTYRKRQSSEEDDVDTENIISKKAHIQSNLDADSDFSIDDSSSEEENDSRNVPKDKNSKINSNQTNTINVNIKIEPAVKSENMTTEEIAEINELKNIKVENDEDESTKDKIEEAKPKEKIDIWKKRTVGEVFDAALQRYYERKSAKTG